MRVLFDIVHPAQVHFFKNAIMLLKNRGDEVLVTARKKDVAIELLKALDIDHLCISGKGSNMAAMGLELITRTFRLLRIARRFRPDVMVARVGHSVGIAGKILGVPTVIYDDMEHARLQAAIGMTFATYICTGLGYYRDFGARQVRFNGPPVLSYLAPAYFTPDRQPLRQAGLDPDKPYIFIRTVSWKASHDIGRKGTGREELTRLVEELSGFARVVISSEDPLPKELLAYRNPVPVEHIHHLLAFAQLCIVEGGTMAEEAAVLGVPAICPKTYDFGYLRALENDYGLVFRPATTAQALEMAREILRMPDHKQHFQEKRRRLLENSEDIVAFMLKMIDKAARHK